MKTGPRKHSPKEGSEGTLSRTILGRSQNVTTVIITMVRPLDITDAVVKQQQLYDKNLN